MPSTTLREKYPIHCRVKLTEKARRHGINPRSGDTGQVVGYGTLTDCIRVLLDGRRTAETYHADFWEPHEDPDDAD